MSGTVRARYRACRWLAPVAALLSVLPADPSPAGAAEGLDARELYEDARLTRALDAAGLTREAHPEGKTIGTIHIIRRDVLAEDEPWPTFFNVFHVMTKEHVVRRELLFAPGDLWDPAIAEETARNLRLQTIFTIVRVVPVRPAHATEDQTVDVAVFTRDLWSLRAETNLQVTGGLINRLALTMIERNLLGENSQAALTFQYLPRTWRIGETYANPRLFGGDLSVTQRLELIFARHGSALEGSLGQITIGAPLRDLTQGWGWVAALSYEDFIGRQLSGLDVLTWDNPDTADVEAVPREWEQGLISLTAGIRRQLAGDVTHRLYFGGSVNDRRLVPTAIEDRATRAAFARDVLPPARRQVYPFLQWSGFVPRYDRLVELAAYGLSEDIRLGPWWSAQLLAPIKAFGSSSDSLVYALSLGWIETPGGGLVDLKLSARGRLEASTLIDQTYAARLRGATPRFVLGRIAWSAHYEARRADSGNSLVTLGGDNGLRGYPSQAFFVFGGDRLRLNVELRTPPVVILSAHVGGVLFWDGGAVWDAGSEIAFRQSAGLGVRVLFPQFNRSTFRLDLGVPLDGSGFTVLVTFGSLQAVPLTEAEDLKLEQ